MLPTFKSGQQLAAADLQEIARQLAVSLNVTTSAPLQVTRSPAGCHLSLGALPTFYGHGQLQADLTPSGSPVDCLLYNYDGSSETSTSVTIKVRCIAPIPWMGNNSWVRVSNDSGVYYAWPLSCKWHGLLAGDLASDATTPVNFTIYSGPTNGGTSTGVTVGVLPWGVPTGFKLSSGDACFIYLDCDGSFYVDMDGTCPVAV